MPEGWHSAQVTKTNYCKLENQTSMKPIYIVIVQECVTMVETLVG